MVGNLVVISEAALDCITATIISHSHHLAMLFAYLSKVSHLINTFDPGRCTFLWNLIPMPYRLYEVITLSNSQQLWYNCMYSCKTGLLMLGKRLHELSSVLQLDLWSRCKTWRETRRNVWVVHNDVIKWKHFPRNWPFVWGIHRSQRPVTRSFNVLFDLCLNKRLSKQSWDWWFETKSRSWWRHSNVFQAWV